MQSVLDDKCKEIEMVLKSRLQNCESVSLTLDIWTDRQTRGYMGITAHYIHDSFIISSVLSVDRFSGEYHLIQKDEHSLFVHFTLIDNWV